MKWGLPGWSHGYLREKIEKLERENQWKHIDDYPYFFADGRFCYVKIRFIGKNKRKTFRQWAATSKHGWTSRKKAGAEPLLYRWNSLAESDEIFLVNGEKAADRGHSELGICTTCLTDGEGKLHQSFIETFRNKLVHIVIDADSTGEKHGRLVAHALSGVAREVKVIRLPDLPPKGDLYDWIEAGGTLEKLREILDSTPVFKPEPVPTDEREEEEAESTADPAKTAPPTAISALDLLEQMYNDTGYADRLILMFGQDLRYCPAFRKWMVWDGRRWAVDEIGRARLLAKKAMLDFLRQAVNKGSETTQGKALQSLESRRISSLLTMAEIELVVTPDQLDTHPFLLNFLNGTLNLETGDLLPHTREHFITKMVHYNYKPDAQCPLFISFVNRIMGCKPDATLGELERVDRMVDYLQRALGYSLTGSTEEKAVFIPFGLGDNGKTTLLSTFLHLLQEYASLLQVDTLMVRQESNNMQADLADLRGARFVMTSETEEGQRLAQAKLKRITQGMGKIKACRKYENPIEFDETHKLWIDTNSRPIIRAVDDKATFNRLHPIPFTQTIPKEEIDKALPRKLLAEAEGILAWAVRGELKRRKYGLDKPPEVSEANEEWRAENDQLGRFIEDCCVLLDGARARARRLYESYRKWAEGSGEATMTETAFCKRIKAKGFRKDNTRAGVDYCGIGLRSEME